MRDSKGRYIKGHKGNTFWKGKKRSKLTIIKVSLALKGRTLSEETKNKMLGRIPWNKGTKGLYKQSIETVKKRVSHFKGKNHWNWKGGISDKNERIRKSLDYHIWHSAVLLRDNYTCQICGMRGGKLEVDHIKPFSVYPELRLAIDNGRAICHECHLKTDTYGNKRKFRENIYEKN